MSWTSTCHSDLPQGRSKPEIASCSSVQRRGSRDSLSLGRATCSVLFSLSPTAASRHPTVPTTPPPRKSRKRRVAPSTFEKRRLSLNPGLSGRQVDLDYQHGVVSLEVPGTSTLCTVSLAHGHSEAQGKGEFTDFDVPSGAREVGSDWLCCPPSGLELDQQHSVACLNVRGDSISRKGHHCKMNGMQD